MNSWVARAARRPAVAAVAVAAVPVVVALAVTAYWLRAGLLPFGGDEPHYLVMANSLALDGDLDLRNNYEHDWRTGELFGPVEPHVFKVERGWFPYHGAGLPLVVALPLRLAGIPGVRLALVLIAGALPFTLCLWLTRQVGPSEAAWLTLAATLSVPFCFGAPMVYPDLIPGVVSLGLALWLVRRPESGPAPPWGWVAYWLAAGLLPWFNVKFIAATAVLAVAGMGQALRWRALTGRAVSAFASFPLVLVGPAALAAFHRFAFGTVWGARGAAELTTDAGRVLLVLLGLHLDQSQGMFMQQPLLLAGVAAFVVLARRDRHTALMLAALYGSLILPNTLQMARFGGGGPAGRFGWSAAWLWFVPLGLVLGHAGRSAALVRHVRPAALATLAWQALLAIRWVPAPRLLFPVLDERIWARDSLFPLAWRYSVPSFYFWDYNYSNYLLYPPNTLAVVGVGLVVAAGVAASGARVDYGGVRRACLVYAMACALLLPTAPRAKDGSPEDAERARGLLRTATSQIARRFEAERLAPRSLQGTTRQDPLASQGEARATRPARSDRLIVFGPWIALDAGRYRADVALRLDGTTDGSSAGTFDVTAGNGHRSLGLQVMRAASLSSSEYRRVGLTFDVDAPADGVEFRFVAEPGFEALLDYVELVPVLPHPERQ